MSSTRRKNTGGHMPLKRHFKEFRNRLIVCVITLLVTSIVGFFLYKPVMAFMIELVSDLGGTINFGSAIAPLDVMIRVALWIGMVLAAPMFIWQIWAFIVPGLLRKEKRLTVSFMAAAIPLFLMGVALGIYVIPHALRFFLSLTPDQADNIIPVMDFLPFVTRLTLAFGIAMVLPVGMVGLNLVGILPAKSILKHWRITVFLITVFSAVAAPGGDALSMFFIAGPMLVLFIAATLFCWILDRRRAKREAKNREAAPTEVEAARAVSAPKGSDEL
ncbi:MULTISPECIES: twin-arginine translocase subunit TatC [Micrococcaceae]|uniref:Sec-independent protein translocase protein TatC n=1 Tax=Pseudoglutamicibacter albus TaxID=98671 RepID=A0ABU1YYL1_9MICC|nr:MULTISPECIES: twin-arginine translocase subunit TatC [Micrococcaceae]MDR7293463.1 sec-independent protein translocase protein TatC [Pseudoglutamicibacter albus]